MNLYGAVLLAHSWLRWAVLLLCLVVIVQAFVAWRRSRAWTSRDESLHVALVAAIDVQFLLGIWLYTALSPVSHAFFAEPGAGMEDPVLRFFGMEHLVAMIVALAIVHVGRVVSRKAPTPARRHARVCWTTVLALVAVLAGIPWPGLPYARPLLRAANAHGVIQHASAAAQARPPLYQRMV